MEEHGELELEPAEDPFRRLVVSIINQQLSTESADAIQQRLFDSFEVEPSTILEAEPQELRRTGLSGQKTGYLKNVADRFAGEEDFLGKLYDMSDEEVMDELTDIKGVGDWTAKMFLIFVLGREDVFPVEDLGIRKGMEQLFPGIGREEMVDKAERWKPYRSIASLYLWRLND